MDGCGIWPWLFRRWCYVSIPSGLSGRNPETRPFPLVTASFIPKLLGQTQGPSWPSSTTQAQQRLNSCPPSPVRGYPGTASSPWQQAGVLRTYLVFNEKKLHRRHSPDMFNMPTLVFAEPHSFLPQPLIPLASLSPLPTFSVSALPIPDVGRKAESLFAIQTSAWQDGDAFCLAEDAICTKAGDSFTKWDSYLFPAEVNFIYLFIYLFYLRFHLR